MNKKTTAVYFSATGTNKRNVSAIAEALDPNFRTLDVTMIDSIKEEQHFSADEIVVIGAPVYGGRIFEGAAERFRLLHGDGTACVVTVTYGNRHYDDALIELADLMTEQGFRAAAAAALVGEHTYGDIQKGRPDANDLTEARAFAERVLEKITAGDVSVPDIPGNHPYKEGGSGGRFRPDTADTCVGCGKCVTDCPQQAIAEDFKSIDDAKCIACFRCIKTCPAGAKCMTDPAYAVFAEDFTKKLSARRENEWFL